MNTTRALTILVSILYVLFWIAVFAGIVYLFFLIVKVLKKYISSKEVRGKRKPLPNPWARL